jgi:hypothetical protein
MQKLYIYQLGAFLFSILGMFLPSAKAGTPYSIDWIHQFGTTGQDWAVDVAADGFGGAYACGYTNGNLDGLPTDSFDAFLSRHDSNGGQEWVRQLGSREYDTSITVSVDGLGHAFIGGSCSGNYPISQNDAFFAKYDAAGNLLKTRVLDSGGQDYLYSLTADKLGNMYFSGCASGDLAGNNGGRSGIFVGKYDVSGNIAWIRQMGSGQSDYGGQLAVDGQGNIYVGGGTEGSLFGANSGSIDAFVAKYDSNGNLLWGRQFGSAGTDSGNSIACDDAGNVYIEGCTWGNLGGTFYGDYDTYVCKYDTDGNPVWIRQFGTASADEGHGVAVDQRGKVYVSGVTWGSLGGPNAGGGDAFVTQFDKDGSLDWTCQFGTSSTDWGNGITVDELGNVFLSGITEGSLGGNYQGNIDAFVAKLSVPEPSTLALLLTAAIGGLFWRRRNR